MSFYDINEVFAISFCLADSYSGDVLQFFHCNRIGSGHRFKRRVCKGLEFGELLDEIEAIVYSGTKISIDYYINEVVNLIACKYSEYSPF